MELRAQTGGDTASAIVVPGSQMCSGELSQALGALGACQGAKAAAHGASLTLLPARRDFLHRGEELSQNPVWSSSSLPCCHPGSLESKLSVGYRRTCF